jgi:nitronate monooxygenase
VGSRAPTPKRRPDKKRVKASAAAIPPMAMHCGGMLAAAVSKAGALGSFGGLHPQRGPDWLLSEIALIRQTTQAPFAVGFINDFVPAMSKLFEATLEARPPVVALSFGNPEPWLSRAKIAGAKVMCQVQTLKQAKEAVAAGADVLVAQGNEAGGHTGRMNFYRSSPTSSTVIRVSPC